MADPIRPTSAESTQPPVSPTRRRGLGRGLGALIASTDTANPASPEVMAQAEAGGVQMTAIDHISPNPEQPRTQFDETALLELAASIREHGIIQPLIVTVNPELGPGHFWLVAGERRWRASHLAGLREVPVIVREATPQQLLEWALVENVQRADLGPLEEAAAYQEMIDRFSLTQAQVADRVGKSRSAVANFVRLLQLPMPIQSSLNDGHISAGHARSLLSLPDALAMHGALKEILAKGLNVRQTEGLVKRMLETPVAAPQPPVDPQMKAHLRSLEDQFRSNLSTKVNLARNPDGSGRLVIHFFSDGDLDNLVNTILGGPEAPL
ncbi:MAG: ParB/RepB/Spo0J family partition protein [Caldilineaceae bacterium]|nr:ParB/RepB/Spo0J family partition protein [Caldilineaceae bacterium]MBP8107530.1 ParB/RepB/Spo0J family partition protein [Caldilineaceae bacterium]MBP8122492.1 ParB/RepB/Spo0J family partition protein [Caldilineaceae bacterium]